MGSFTFSAEKAYNLFVGGGTRQCDDLRITSNSFPSEKDQHQRNLVQRNLGIMCVRPRVQFVGYLLVLGLALCGCQPVQPVSATQAPPVREVVAASEPVTDTAVGTVTTTVSDTVSNTVVVTDTAGVTDSSDTSDPSTAAADPALVVAGLAVYRTQYCGVCHTLDAAETRGTFGPVHNGLGATAVERVQDESYHGAATTATEYIRESIVDPQAYIVPGYAATSHRMPVYAHLDSESIDALVAFLISQ